MFNFDIKKTAIYRAVKWSELPVFKFANFFEKLFLILFGIVFLLFVYGFVFQNFLAGTSRKLLGLSIILLISYLSVSIKGSFFESKLKHPKLKVPLSSVVLSDKKYNLAEFLNFGAAKAVVKALRYCRSSEVDSIHLFYFLLTENPKLEFIFSRLLLRFKGIKNSIRKEIKNIPRSENVSLSLSKNFEDTILDSFRIAKERKHLRVREGDVLFSLAKNDSTFEKILINNKLRVEDIENLISWFEDIEEKEKKRKRFWDYDNLIKRGTLAKEWTSGYTIVLDKYSQDLTESLRNKSFAFVDHEEELNSMERILSQTEINNVLMIGEAGTGKRSIVYSFIKRSLSGKSLPEINYKRVVELNLAELLTQIESTEEVEFVLDSIFKEVVRAGNIILFIDEFNNYVGQSFKAGVIDISGVIAPYLRSPRFRIIATSTYEGLHRHIEKNSSILTLFEKVEVSIISKKDTLVLLEYLTFLYERKYKIFISYPALRQIVDFGERYFPSLPFPEKAIDILDSVSTYVANSTEDKVILPKHIAKIVTEKTEIPVGRIELKEKKILLNMENLIHKRVINQEEAVRDIATALRRARSDVSARKGPMGTFLFLGPTGVGKTETAKALADSYFGSEDNMIRLDMSEFQTAKDIQRLIGSFDQEGILTTKVRENPFSLVLLDEIEKSNSGILNLFLQVLDDGRLTDGIGRIVSFKDTIIIATGNAGYKVILKALKDKITWSEVKQKLLDYLFQKRIFRPEFINRFDGFVVFKPLSQENLLDISELMLTKVRKNLLKKGIEFIITDGIKKKMVELGYNPTFGAREMKRTIQNKVENVLAAGLLSGELKKGQKVTVDPVNFKLIISSQL